MTVRRYLFLGLGWVSVALGFVGVVMPILPTTPFLLVAVWAFSRSSPELAEKIRNHRTFGPSIRGWQDHGVIPAAAKAIAMLMMSAMGVYLVQFSGVPQWASYSACVIMGMVAIYILSRPSRAPQV